MIVDEQKPVVGAPPYNSISTFTNFLDWIKAMPVTPSHIDRSLWSDKFGGSVGTQLMTGLRFLRLLDGEVPTPRLEELARATEEERRPMLDSLLGDVYGQDVVTQLRNGTPKRLNDALSALGTTTATHDKARSFLVNVAKLAGIEIQPLISKMARVRKPGSGKRVTPTKQDAKKAGSNGSGDDQDGREGEGGQGEQGGQGGQGNAQSSLLIRGLFERLPEPGSDWPEQERRAWMKAAESIFQLEYRQHVQTHGEAEATHRNAERPQDSV